MTVSYQAIEVPAEAKPVDEVPDKIKAEPIRPGLPTGRDYHSIDIRAQRLGVYAVALRKWGRSLVTAIDAREEGDAAIVARQNEERAAALARLAVLREAEADE